MAEAKKKSSRPKNHPPAPVGRPVTRNRDEIALELLKWGTKPDSINLNGFCCSLIPPLSPQKLVQYVDESDQFREAYNIVKSFIAQRRECMLNNETLHVKAYDLNAAVYDYFLKKEKRDQLEFESKLKSEEVEKVDQSQVERMTEFFKTVKSAQESSSHLNNAKSNINNDA